MTLLIFFSGISFLCYLIVRLVLGHLLVVMHLLLLLLNYIDTQFQNTYLISYIQYASHTGPCANPYILNRSSSLSRTDSNHWTIVSARYPINVFSFVIVINTLLFVVYLFNDMLVYKLYNTLTNLGIALDSAGWQFFRFVSLSFTFSFFRFFVFFIYSFNLY